MSKSIRANNSFNSRTPCGVRLQHRYIVEYYLSFNSRTPCGVRLIGICQEILVRSFNSRTPCGVRHNQQDEVNQPYQFQFTHPVRGATVAGSKLDCDVGVSIHAPRAGCDFLLSVIKRYRLVFQFTHPVRGATTAHTLKELFLEFQFTHPVRGATFCVLLYSHVQ